MGPGFLSIVLLGVKENYIICACCYATAHKGVTLCSMLYMYMHIHVNAQACAFSQLHMHASINAQAHTCVSCLHYRGMLYYHNTISYQFKAK